MQCAVEGCKAGKEIGVTKIESFFIQVERVIRDITDYV